MSFISKIKDKLQTSGKASKFNNVEKEIFNGNFSKALSLLEEIEKNPNNTEEEIIECQEIKAYGLTNNGNPPGALEIVDKLLENHSNLSNRVLLGKIYITQASILYDLNKIPESSDALEKGIEIIEKETSQDKNDFNEIRAKIHYLKGRIARKKNEIPTSLEELNKSLEFRSGTKNLDGLGDIYAELGILYFMTRNPDQSISSLLEAIAIFRRLNSKSKLLKAYNNIGMIYQRMQNPEKSLEFLLLSSKLLEEFGDQFKPQLCISSLNIGIIYIDKGEIDQAIGFLERAINLADQLGAQEQKGLALQGLAVIYEVKGDLQHSLDLYNECLKIFEELKNDHQIAAANNNIGNLYILKGEINQSINYFEKALTIFTSLNDSEQISVNLYNLVVACATINNLDKANAYVDQLKLQLDSNENKLIEQVYRLAKAEILKKSKRIIKKAEAQLIYQQIAYEDVIKHQNTVDSMFNLCEMLIQELRSSGNETIISEVKDVISKLIDIAQNQNSFKVLVQSKMLQSKVALLELDLNTAKESLNEAQNIAFDKGLDNLAMVISGEYDALIDQLSKWTDLIDSNVSMIERLEMAELEGLVSNMVRKKADSPEMLAEIPELFLVLNDQGMKIYSKVFSEDSSLDDQVVGDLLTAVNSFLQETFSATGSIERLKHKEYTLMLKPIDKYLTCYVFKGQSYTALQKLEKFIDSLRQKEKLYQSVINTETEITDQDFSTLVTSIFTAKATAEN